MARRRRGGRRVFYGEIDGIDNYIEKLQELNADLKTIVGDALEQAADDPTADTIDAMQDQYMPAGGKYSTGNTKDTIIKNPKTEWRADIGAIGIGFDKTKNGAGSLLITGTPRMKPNSALAQIYTRKKTNKEFFETVTEALENAINELGG